MIPFSYFTCVFFLITLKEMIFSKREGNGLRNIWILKAITCYTCRKCLLSVLGYVLISPLLLCALCLFEDIIYHVLVTPCFLCILSNWYMLSIFDYQSVMNYRKILNSCVCNKVDLAFLVWLLGCIYRGILFSIPLPD